MTYMQSWKSLRPTSHTWLGLNPQIERPLSRIVVPLVYLFLSCYIRKQDTDSTMMTATRFIILSTQLVQSVALHLQTPDN
jgi:hypothetical protein